MSPISLAISIVVISFPIIMFLKSRKSNSKSIPKILIVSSFGLNILTVIRFILFSDSLMLFVIHIFSILIVIYIFKIYKSKVDKPMENIIDEVSNSFWVVLAISIILFLLPEFG